MSVTNQPQIFPSVNDDRGNLRHRLTLPVFLAIGVREGAPVDLLAIQPGFKLKCTLR